MQNADNTHHIPFKPVNKQVRQRGHHQFARVGYRSNSATGGKTAERLGRIIKPANGWFGQSGIILAQVRSDMLEIFRRRGATTVAALRAELLVNTLMYFFVFYKLTAIQLLDADLNLLPEPCVMVDKASDSLLCNLIGAAFGRDRNLFELPFLLRSEMHFHAV
jgi:hypothetical protein